MIGKVERKSLRLKNYDYSSNGLYFITVCAYDKQHVFGKIVNGEVQLSQIGRIAEEEIFSTNRKRKGQFIEITKYVIMPNHIHMIISIHKPEIFHEYKQEDFGKPCKEAVSSVVRSYKSAVTKRVFMKLLMEYIAHIKYGKQDILTMLYEMKKLLKKYVII